MKKYCEDSCIEMVAAPMVLLSALFAFNNNITLCIVSSGVAFSSIVIACGIKYVRIHMQNMCYD
jgi:hypothetical protein